MNTSGSDLSSASPVAEDDTRSAAMKWMIAATVSLPAILALADPNVLGPVIRYVAGNLSVTPAEMVPTLRAYGAASVVSFVLLSLGGRGIGSKRLFQVSLIGFTFASVLCGLSSTSGMLLAVHAAEGFAAGGLLVAAFAILCQLFSSARPLNITAIFYAVALVLGPVLGPAVGGYLTDNFGWRWIFYANLPLCIAALLLAWRLVPGASPGVLQRARLDWTNLVLETVALVSWMTFFGSLLWR